MAETESAPQTAAADRMTKLEARVAELERRLSASVATTDTSLRNLRREIGTVSRAMTNRGGRGE